MRVLPGWLRQRLDPTQRYGLRLTLVAVAAALVAVPFSFLLLQVLSAGPVTEVDQGIADGIYAWIRDSAVLVGLSHVLSFLGTPPLLTVMVCIAALWLVRRGFWRLSLFVVATPLIGGAITSVVKILVDRPRPEFEDPIAQSFGRSFPSGHAMGSTITYGTLLLAFMPLIPRHRRRAVVAGYVTLVVLIGASRLGLGVHYLSDVIGGSILGVAWLCLSVAAFRIWRRDQKKVTPDVTEGAEPEVAREAS